MSSWLVRGFLGFLEHVVQVKQPLWTPLLCDGISLSLQESSELGPSFDASFAVASQVVPDPVNKLELFE